MKYAFNVCFFALASFLMISCGTNKKLSAANTQINDLNNQLNSTNASLAERDKQISQLKEASSKNYQEAQDCKLAKDAADANLKKLENELEAEAKAIDEVAEKAVAAVQKLVDAGAEVTLGDGMVYVSMPDKFLFKTGSASVGSKGKEGLAVIAEILMEYPKTQAIVVGNTDTATIKGKADNWSLSTERANAVVRILKDTYKIDPARLTAAGHGKFRPIASNDTAEGREKNRRIEFVLIPDLSGLWEMLDME
ncbi:MAG: OmpA family protein [Chitinophagaceae bacterium]